MFVFKYEWLKKTVFAHQPFVPSDARKVNDVLSKHSVEPNKSKLIRTEMIKETQRNAKKRQTRSLSLCAPLLVAVTRAAQLRPYENHHLRHLYETTTTGLLSVAVFPRVYPEPPESVNIRFLQHKHARGPLFFPYLDTRRDQLLEVSCELGTAAPAKNATLS